MLQKSIWHGWSFRDYKKSIYGIIRPKSELGFGLGSLEWNLGDEAVQQEGGRQGQNVQGYNPKLSKFFLVIFSEQYLTGISGIALHVDFNSSF